jgi:hypothetical protein
MCMSTTCPCREIADTRSARKAGLEEVMESPEVLACWKVGNARGSICVFALKRCPWKSVYGVNWRSLGVPLGAYKESMMGVLKKLVGHQKHWLLVFLQWVFSGWTEEANWKSVSLVLFGLQRRSTWNGCSTYENEVHLKTNQVKKGKSVKCLSVLWGTLQTAVSVQGIKTCYTRLAIL